MTTLYNYCKENNKEYLLQEWDYELNKDLDIQTITIGSNKRVWWKCSFCKNTWKTSICHRTINNSGCPKCHYAKRKRYNIKNNLTITHPEIAKHWHPTKNEKLISDFFTKESSYKAWWKCPICGKEIQKEIRNYSGCKECKRKAKLEGNNLASKRPDLIPEWNHKKNGNLKPTDVTPCSGIKVWWKCLKCNYEWQAKIGNRAILNRGCPCCTNQKVVVGINDLATTHPEIAREWHPTKNGSLMPQSVTHGTGKKVWWLCPLGHEYQATVLHRTQGNGTNCPICSSGIQTSFAEQAVYYYVKQIFPDAINRYTTDFLGKMELDIFIPSINCAIEYDGEAWHKVDKLEREQRKYKICKDQNITLIRMREKKSLSLINISDFEISGDKLYLYNNLEIAIADLINLLRALGNGFCNYNNNINIKKDKYKILQYKTRLKGETLQEKYPQIAKEWHPTKNGKLKPDMFKPSSGHKIWWLCPICGNEYETTINHRTTKIKPTSCPKCGIERRARLKRRKVNMINPNTNEILQTFVSIREASKKMNIAESNIGMVCRNEREKAGGYKWSYVEQ